MQRIKFILFLFLGVLTITSNASPFPLLPPHNIQLSNSTSKCPNPNNLTESNWHCTNVNTFLSDWWSQNGHNCRKQPFYQCFADFFNYTYFPCGDMGTPCIPGELMNWHAATEAYYVIVAIANVNQFFINMHNALGTASNIMNELLPQLSNQLKPPHGGTSLAYKEVSVVFQSLLYTIPVGPQLWTLVAGAWQGVNIDLNSPIDDRFINFGQFSNDLGEMTKAFQKQIVEMQLSAISNFANFTGIVSTGKFLYGHYAGVNTTEQAFEDMFESYLKDKMVNLILRSKKTYAVMSPNIIGHGPPGQWDTYSHLLWTDPQFKLLGVAEYPVFYLTDPCQTADDYSKMDKTLFGGDNPITTPAKVFDISWKCQNETGQLGGGSKGFNITDLNDCLYNIPICYDNTASNPWDPSFPEYKNCPSTVKC